MSPGRATPAKPYRAQRPEPAGPGLITAFRGIMSTGVDAGFARPAVFTGVFALRGGDQQLLAATMERIASIAPQLSHHDLRNLACQWGQWGQWGRDKTGAGDREIRVSLTARSQAELAERATRAARLVRGLRDAGPMASDGGVHVSRGARGRVVLVFPGGVTASGAARGVRPPQAGRR
jgi:hypothetical protein